MASPLDPILQILQVNGSTPWNSYKAPEEITATTKLPAPPSQLATVLKNFTTFTGIGGAAGALAGAAAMLGSAPVGGIVITAAAGAAIGGMFGLLEGMFLSGRDARLHDEALERRAEIREEQAQAKRRRSS